MLNTLKTNLILTRAVLIALFAGLFILAACGGGSKAAAPTTTGPGPNICDTNPFGATCTRAADATARTMQISDCATSIDTDASDRDCDFVPLNVIYCLEDPLLTAGSTACDATAYDTARQGSGVTLATVTDTRRNLCRGNADRNNNKLCTNTIVENCGDDSNPFDLLCGRLNPARNAIIEICVDSATLADSTKNADCLAARTAGFTCFDNPWAESCVTSTMYREFASFRANAQASRLEYCMDDDADAGVCGSALARVCSDSGDGANPFSDLCTGNAYNTVRADFATNCFNRKATDNDVTDCTVTAFEVPRTGTPAECDGEDGNKATLMPNDPTCMATPVTVQACVQAPFSTNCRPVDTFDNTRSALLDICTNGVPDAKDFFCGTTNGGFKADEATCIDNPFTANVDGGINCGTLFTALGTTVKTAQDNLIAGCTGADADGMNTRCDSGIAGAEVAACLANPFETNCDMILGSETQATTAQNNIISLCTGTDASVITNTLCTGLPVSANNVKACIDNPFLTAVGDLVPCTMALGSVEAVMLAQSNLIEVCTGADADGSDARCGITATGNGTLTACLADPFDATCDTALGDGAMTAQNNLIALCIGTDAINTPNQRCSGITSDSDVQTCLDNPFTTTGLSGSVTCATALGGAGIVTTAQNNLIEVCTRANADSLTSRCFSAVSGCLADPFGATCDTELGATQAMTARSNLIELCSVGNPASQSSVLCVGLRNTSAGTCINDPFTPNVADGMNDINCETILGTTVLATLQDEVYDYCSRAGDDRIPTTCINLVNNVICLGTNTNSRTNPFDTRCEDVANIDTPTTGARAMFCGLGTNNADIPACTDTVRATCIATPFASECYADGNPYDLHRAQAILACAGVPKDDRATSDLCMDVEIKAEVPVSDSNPTLIEAVTLIDCVGDLFNGDCAAVVFAPARGALATACRDSGDRDMEPACDVVVKAQVPVSDSNPTLIEAVTVEDCVDQPFSADCASDVFENTRFLSAFQCGLLEKTARADSVCEQVIVAAGSNPETDPAVTVATCVDNPFASACQTLEDFSFERILLVQDCTNGVVNLTTGMIDSVATDAACATTIGDTSTTISDCNTDPFQADCETLNAFESTRCTSNPFYTECLGNDVYANDRCEARPFGADCVDHDTYDSARDDSCTSPTASNYNVFNVNCTETAYTGTDAARKTLADGCRAGTTTTGCDAVVSDATDAPTITMCNTNPYATGCDATVFADALTAYCADGADTIFNTNCDSRTGIATVRSVAIGVCVAALTTDKTDASCTGREIVAGEEEVTAIIAGTTMIDHDNNPATPDIVARAEDARAGVPAIPAVTVGSCLDDPFHTGCTSDLFDFARADHMEVCMSNGNANLPSCATLATAEPCVRNPFLASCMTATVGNRFKNARAARYAFCEGSRAGSAASVATGDTDLCGIEGTGGTGTTVRGEICSYGGGDEGERLNPFAGVCADNTYVSSKKYYCGVGGRRASDANCNDIVADNSINTADGCLANPFSASCTGYTVPSTGATITEELRTFLTTQRTTYCTAVDAEGFDATLCQTADTTDADFASTVCAGLGEDGNPFAPFCVRDNNEFDAHRVTFVEACGALTGGATRLGANADGATCAPEVIACYAAPFVAGTGATDCIGEDAYAMARQGVVTNCANAVTTDSSTAGANADCMTIDSVGQLDCITTNPYLNRAADAGAGVTALNCLGNGNYAVVRNALESDAVCKADGTAADGVTDARCGTVLAGVCGTGTAGSELAIGTDPFNEKFCLDATNRPNYVDQRETLVANCVANPDAAGCTTQINACIADPFLADGIATGVNCDDDRFKVAFQARSIAYCGLESKDVGGTPTLNISRGDCRAFATTLAQGNPCVLNPFSDACTNELLGGAAGETTELDAAQTLRATYCETLGTSDAIRVLADESVCRGAVSEVCKGDALFDQTGTGYDCFNDKTTYDTARDTYATMTCSGNTAARNGAECTNAIVEICDTTDGLQTNPWAAACNEASATDDVESVTERLAVVTHCAGLATDELRTDTPRCAKSDAALVYTTCNPTSGDPRMAACNDYADAGEPFADARLARYALSCAGASPDPTLCPTGNVQPAICVTNGDNSRPFAPICATGVTNIETYKTSVLLHCLTDATDEDARCVELTAPSTKSVVDLVKGQCGGSLHTDNPFNGAVSVNGVTAALDCTDYDFFNTDRTNFRTACRNAGAASLYTDTTCDKGGVLALVCNASTGEFANPFSGICTTADAGMRRAFADSCVGATAPLGNGATCPPAVIACADNPFGSLCSDAAYVGQKVDVLEACNTVTKYNGNARCAATVANAPAGTLSCLTDPINCTTTGVASAAYNAPGSANTQFAALGETGSGAIQPSISSFLTTIRNARFTHCQAGNNVQSEPLCRTAGTTLARYCLVNPFAGGCEANSLLGGNPTAFKTARRTHCLGDLDGSGNPTADRANALKSATGTFQAVAGATTLNLCVKNGGINTALGRETDTISEICLGAVGTGNLATTADADKTKDPFSAFCGVFTGETKFARYDARRLERFGECAGEAGTSDGSTFTPANDAAFECTGYTIARINNCNNAADATARNALGYCPAEQTTANWSPTNTQTLNQVSGENNRFLLGLTTSMPIFTHPNNLEIVDAGRTVSFAARSTLPQVRFFSGRTAEVEAVEARAAADAVTAINIGDIIGNGPDGMPNTADDVLAEAGDVREAKDAVTQRDEVLFQAAGTTRFYAGLISNTGINVGAPLFDRATTTAIWTGNIDWIGAGDAANATGVRTGFNMLVNYAALSIQGAVPIDGVADGLGDHLVINGTYTGAGIISGTTYIRNYNTSGNRYVPATPNILAPGDTGVAGTVSGIIGHKGAVGAFISGGSDNTNGFAGGFVVQPPTGNQ